jgi:hypothetical protein
MGIWGRKCLWCTTLRSMLTHNANVDAIIPYNKMHAWLKVRWCRNPNLGFATKAKACKGAGQERSPRATSYAPRSVGKCEGMNAHTSQGSSHFGSWIPSGLLNLQRTIAGVKTHWIEAFLISLESSWNLDV